MVVRDAGEGREEVDGAFEIAKEAKAAPEEEVADRSTRKIESPVRPSEDLSFKVDQEGAQHLSSVCRQATPQSMLSFHKCVPLSTHGLRRRGVAGETVSEELLHRIMVRNEPDESRAEVSDRWATKDADDFGA